MSHLPGLPTSPGERKLFLARTISNSNCTEGHLGTSLCSNRSWVETEKKNSDKTLSNSNWKIPTLGLQSLQANWKKGLLGQTSTISHVNSKYSSSYIQWNSYPEHTEGRKSTPKAWCRKRSWVTGFFWLTSTFILSKQSCGENVKRKAITDISTTYLTKASMR